MRKIYLIRHAMPELPGGKRLCLGWTDIPLGAVGRMQSVLLAEFMKDRPVCAVFCSDLSRSLQTAQYLHPQPTVIPELREMSAGVWDGLDFDLIQKTWPELYEKRSHDPNYPIPGAENTEKGQARFLRGVQASLAQSQGDIAIVAHATVNQSLICHTRGIDPDYCRQFKLGHASVITLHHFDGVFHPVTLGETPHPPLNEALCEKLLCAAGASEETVQRSRQVARRAVEIVGLLREAGLELDEGLVCHSALLHDIARHNPAHSQMGARWLRTLGYPEIAEIVEAHHDPRRGTVDEGDIVFLAENETHADAARTLKEKINALCGRTIL